MLQAEDELVAEGNEEESDCDAGVEAPAGAPTGGAGGVDCALVSWLVFFLRLVSK